MHRNQPKLPSINYVNWFALMLKHVSVILALVVSTSASAVSIDLGPATGYNLFIKESFTQPGADSQGKIAIGGIGVEKVFPLYLPSIEKVQVLKKPKVRRAKLYYLRDKTSREIKKKMKQEKIS